jgi:hypothetical protein
MFQPMTGAGDSLTAGLSLGAGDPVGVPVLGAGNYLNFSAQGYVLATLYQNYSGRQAANGDWVGQEGGYTLRMYAPTGSFEHGPYLVKVIDANGQGWPIDEAGCHSTQLGQGANCRPRFANTVLDFATPRVPEGLFSVRVTDARGMVFDVPVGFRAVRTPYSREVATIRARLPEPVYNPYPEGEA